MRTITGALLSIVLLSGCGGGGADDAAPTRPVASSPATTGPTTLSDLPGTCAAYFGDGDADALSQRVLRAVTASTLRREDLVEYEATAEEVRNLAAVSQPELRRPLQVHADLLEDFAEDIRRGGGRTHELEAFEAAGLVLADYCRVHLATH